MGSEKMKGQEGVSATSNHKNELSTIDIAGNSLTAAMHTGFGIASPFTREIFLKDQLPIVGMRYQGGSLDMVSELAIGSKITFLREPENRYDQKAIMALDSQDRKLGYIPRNENAILSALMDAGKTLYGVVSRIPNSGELRSYGPPTVLYVDLYMREFAMPEDLTQIPRQGYQGSYAVIDLEVEGSEEDPKIRSIYAIRVINGEERGSFSMQIPEAEEIEKSVEEGADDKAVKQVLRDEAHYEKLIRGVWHITGYLPVVLCDYSGKQQEALENGWGVYVGRPFSNQVIEICKMAENHLPELSEYSLETVTDRLGIKEEGDSKRETRCRQIWKIYCRLDKSELERKSTCRQ